MGVDFCRLAIEIETALWEELDGQGGTKKYLGQMREVHFNLKDKKNKEFRESVLLREFSAKDLTTITAEQMASSHIKNQRQKIKKWNLKAHSSDARLKKNPQVEMRLKKDEIGSIKAATLKF